MTKLYTFKKEQWEAGGVIRIGKMRQGGWIKRLKREKKEGENFEDTLMKES